MIKVFLVEDEVVIRESIHKMIPWEEYGFEFIGEAQDGELALPLIRELKPDVVITDIKMPFMDGLALSRFVKKEFPETKIIIVSGYDDFSYAKEAINIGVEQYLLKPISKNAFIDVLKGIRDKCEKEDKQKFYYEQYQRELQEYEQNSRIKFFEQLVSGNCEVSELYEHADKLSLNLAASQYNILLFSIDTLKGNTMMESQYSQNTATVQERITQWFQEQGQVFLFRNQMFSYAVLLKSDGNEIEEVTERCIQSLQQIFIEENEIKGWFICTGKPVERLSQISVSYEEAMKLFGYRYAEGIHLVRYGEKNAYQNEDAEAINLKNLDMEAINPEMIRNFLGNALADEVDSFTENYMDMIGVDALKSRIFRQYVILNVYMNVISFVISLGYDKDEMEKELSEVCSQQAESVEETAQIIRKTLFWGISLRDNNVQKKHHSVIQSAVTFIQENYADETLNLNKVACAANVSANHFSALFSQEMQQTFVEYLTNLRMKKAKELLRCSDKRSGEIATEVGYKDAHYFSFLFKKTQGCTPSEYRNKKE